MSRLRTLFQIPNQLILRTVCTSRSLPKKFPTVENYRSSAIINQFRQFSANTSESKLQDESKEPTKPLAKIQARLMIQFTCKKCDTRSSKTMSKLAYEKGIVIIRCDGCKNNHLIADNLGWFNGDRQKVNIEKLMQLNGEKVKRLNAYGHEIFEVVEKKVLVMKSVDKK
ncbi:GSCOCG00004352001-RA-CDS [Cotesia congregata]|uniref:Similar to DNLZ: DNL-type zinc finger protein (Homo sapiens) n=1 Tax=Cotesia congregata TaxID=51543 RepID=A0A8J2EKG9_COTCN|nr:GSCOCG00004352001-RA-CDS [Cotesia congregata]CAG5075592.1 Similar to DNLZ: DNL-type zinc finger protein (Homo sapiens) [Cotesia congregata]